MSTTYAGQATSPNRQPSTRTSAGHQRQTSVSRSASTRQNDAQMFERRDHETVRLVPTANQNRHDYAQPSSASTTAAEDSSRRPLDAHNHPGSQRPRKTSIHGLSGTWILGKTIGAGSMGKVKLARKAEGTEQVAVKIVPRHSPERNEGGSATASRQDDSKEIRTAREAAIVTLLHHPYICGMRDVVRTNHHWYMLFEYVNGGQMLDYIISHGRLKEKQARKFGRQIASALDYCHRNSIVHRDLKIENILISKNGDIKIIDFGLSNLFSPRAHLRTFCGSLYFAAPELLQAKQYIGPEVDVWSFGIVLYVLVCGKVPFDDQSMPALHAKIKRGLVDYPQWLSADCRNLLSRMLVTDPKLRAPLSEILSHPWMTKGYNFAPENHLPVREPLQLPLDPKVINGMTGFEFGTSAEISSQLARVIESEDYQQAVRTSLKENSASTPNVEKKKGFGFDFYKRRSSTTSKDSLPNPSSEGLTQPSAYDPVNAYHPLISVYFLVKEKQQRELESAINPSLPGGSGTMLTQAEPGPLKVPHLPVPETAHTSDTSYEFRGEKSVLGRSRPRARTHGDDEINDAMKKVSLGAVSLPPSPGPVATSNDRDDHPIRKESAAAGLLRRFSTRRHGTRESTKSQVPTSGGPSRQTNSVEIGPPRKSLSVRRPRDAPPISGQSSPRTEDLVTPPTTADGSTKKTGKIGRSTSVSEADWRRRYTRNTQSAGEEERPTAYDGRNLAPPEPFTRKDRQPPSQATPRTKSVGHSRKESLRKRRDDLPRDVPEEDLATSAGSQEAIGSSLSSDYVRPVYLKGLFSVATTSTKPPSFIRADIIRVLDQLGVQYREIKGGFECMHSPSIDLKSVIETNTVQDGSSNQGHVPSHRRRLSFAGSNAASSYQGSPLRSPSRRHRHDQSYPGSDVSDSSAQDQSNIQSPIGEDLVLQFDIYIVKVPLLSLHGIQFKRLGGNTWQYKSLASKILSELRL